MSDPLSEPETASRSVVIETRGLGRRFGRLRAVDDLDLEVRRGEVFGFLGPNGAGKSTAIRMLMGLLEPSSGHARVLGHSVPEQVEKLRRHVGYMTQSFSLYEDLTVAENLEFAAEIFGLSSEKRGRRIEQALEEFDLEARRDQMPATLSGGWRQRLALAVATVHDPELLFLDEPTAGVDPDSRRLFWGKLFEIAGRGATILVSTHYMDEAVRCHRLCVMREGRRAALGKPEDLIAALDGRVLEAEVAPAETELVIDTLTHSEAVASVAQLGSRLHVLLRHGFEASPLRLSEVRDTLLRVGVEPRSLQAAEANLEDVFVALAHGESLPGAMLPKPEEGQR